MNKQHIFTKQTTQSNPNK